MLPNAVAVARDRLNPGRIAAWASQVGQNPFVGDAEQTTFMLPQSQFGFLREMTTEVWMISRTAIDNGM